MRTDILDRRDEIVEWIAKNQSKAFMCRQLQCKAVTLERALKILGLQYEGNKGGKGIKINNTKKSALEYLQSTCVKSHVAKLKLLEDKIKSHKCESCHQTEWLGNLIPLELDHVDGNHFNNKLENIRLICPNCHAIMPTNSGKNKALKNKARVAQRQRHLP